MVEEYEREFGSFDFLLLLSLSLRQIEFCES